MTREEINALFPLKGIITKEIIQSADVYDNHNCIGANALKQSLGEDTVSKFSDIKWGDCTGSIYPNTKDIRERVRIITEENVSMMNVTKPQEVTFIIMD